jgi:hypothetical protein
MIAAPAFRASRAVRLLEGPALGILLDLRVNHPEATADWLASETSRLSGESVGRKQISRTLLTHGLPTTLARARLSTRRQAARPVSPDALAALLAARQHQLSRIRANEKRRCLKKRSHSLKWHTDRYRKEWRRLLRLEHRRRSGRLAAETRGAVSL